MGDLNKKWAAAREAYYHHVHIDGRGKNEPTWRGARVVKFPSDLILYAQAIQQNKPDVIIETGTAYGGSALFFSDMLNIFNPGGLVITVDVSPRINFSNQRDYPGIKQLIGSSVDPNIFGLAAKEVCAGKVMVVLDSDHRGRHVFQEMRMYGKLVTSGQFMVVEDSYTKNERPYGPAWAVEHYLRRTNKFRLEPVEDQFIFAVTRKGWLRRV